MNAKDSSLYHDQPFEPQVLLFTDGSCRGNPGPGGWALILRHPVSGKEKQLAGGHPATTNNRMEMMAVIKGLESLTRPTAVQLISDSEYVVLGINERMAGYAANGWRRGKARQPLKNKDLWQRVYALCQTHQVKGTWIRGHAGHPENERCDELAVRCAEQVIDMPIAKDDDGVVLYEG